MFLQDNFPLKEGQLQNIFFVAKTKFVNIKKISACGHIDRLEIKETREIKTTYVVSSSVVVVVVEISVCVTLL